VKPSLSHAELRAVFEGFVRDLQSQGSLRRYSGVGVVEAFTIHDPAWRIVIDTRVPATPAKAFDLYVDDANAPEPHAEILIGGETLDKAFCGELHVRSAIGAGLIAVTGDQALVIRLIPVMMEVVPQYRAWRSEYVRKHRPAPHPI
jgi:hypothetical protein